MKGHESSICHAGMTWSWRRRGQVQPAEPQNVDSTSATPQKDASPLDAALRKRVERARVITKQEDARKQADHRARETALPGLQSAVDSFLECMKAAGNPGTTKWGIYGTDLAAHLWRLGGSTSQAGNWDCMLDTDGRWYRTPHSAGGDPPDLLPPMRDPLSCSTWPAYDDLVRAIIEELAGLLQKNKVI